MAKLSYMQARAKVEAGESFPWKGQMIDSLDKMPSPDQFSANDPEQAKALLAGMTARLEADKRIIEGLQKVADAANSNEATGLQGNGVSASQDIIQRGLIATTEKPNPDDATKEDKTPEGEAGVVDNSQDGKDANEENEANGAAGVKAVKPVKTAATPQAGV